MHNQEAGHRNEISDVLDLLGRDDADDMRGNFFETPDVMVERTEFSIRCGQSFRAAKRDIYVCSRNFCDIGGVQFFFRKVCGLQRGVAFKRALAGKVDYNKTRTGVKCQCEFLQGFRG